MPRTHNTVSIIKTNIDDSASQLPLGPILPSFQDGNSCPLMLHALRSGYAYPLIVWLARQEATSGIAIDNAHDLA